MIRRTITSYCRTVDSDFLFDSSYSACYSAVLIYSSLFVNFGFADSGLFVVWSYSDLPASSLLPVVSIYFGLAYSILFLKVSSYFGAAFAHSLVTSSYFEFAYSGFVEASIYFGIVYLEWLLKASSYFGAFY
jgi:hypothetical protein